MTGIVSSIADYIALNQLNAALLAVFFVVAFTTRLSRPPIGCIASTARFELMKE